MVFNFTQEPASSEMLYPSSYHLTTVLAGLAAGLVAGSLGAALAHADEPPHESETAREREASGAADAPAPARQEAGSAPADGADTAQPARAQDDSAAGAADPIDLGQGEVIVITGSRVEQARAATTVATEVITRDEIEGSGASSVAELLQKHPGIELQDGLQGSSVSIQGLDPRYVLILVDGKRVAGRVEGAVDLERYNLENIERIEVVKGASSALYGSDAIAGVVNIITRGAGRPLEAELSAQYGELGRLDGSGMVGVRRGSLQTRFSGGYHQGDGYDLEPATAHTTGSAYSQWQAANQTSISRGPLELTATLDYLRRDLRRVDSSIAGPVEITDDQDVEAQAILDRRSVVELATGSLRGQWQLAGNKHITTTLDYSLYRDQLAYDQREAEDLDRYEETFETQTGLSSQLDGSFGASHFITTGIEGMREFLDTPRLRERSGNTTCDPDDESAGCERTADRYRAAFFVQDEWQIASERSLIVVPGVRVDLDSQFGGHVSPKVALRWDPDASLTFRLSYGGGYRAPDFKQLYLCFENFNAGYFIVGNPALEPETSHNLNAGFEHRPHPRLWLSFNGFYNDLSQLITYLPVATAGQRDLPACSMNMLQAYSLANITSAFTRGGEVLLRAQPPLGALDGITIELGYVLTDSRDMETELPLPGVAWHRGSIKLGYELPEVGFEAKIRASLVGARPFPSIDEMQASPLYYAEPHALVDARVGQRIGKQLTFFAGVKNLLGEGDVRYLPVAPRMFYGGLTARY